MNIKCKHHSKNSPVFVVAKDKDNKSISIAKECSKDFFSRADQNCGIRANTLFI
jgi:hypothetical protein